MGVQVHLVYLDQWLALHGLVVGVLHGNALHGRVLVVQVYLLVGLLVVVYWLVVVHHGLLDLLGHVHLHVLTEGLLFSVLLLLCLLVVCVVFS